MERESGKFFEMLFMQMVMSLNEAAMSHMGKIANPVTDQVERNLQQAQGTIDLLRMLQVKTKDNLAEQEKQLLDQAVMNLQMNFAYEQEQSEKDPMVASAPEESLVENPSEDEDDEDDPSSLGNRPGMEN